MLDLFDSAPQLIWTIVLLAVVAYALLRGGVPERCVALASVAISLLSGLLENRSDWVDPQWGVLGLDCLFLALLFWFALRSDRFWPIPAASFQLLGVVTHLASATDRTVAARAYYVAGVIWSYLLVISLAVGVWSHARRRRALELQPASGWDSAADGR